MTKNFNIMPTVIQRFGRTLYVYACPICGRTFMLAEETVEAHTDAPRLQFNYCNSCSRYVCGDCFVATYHKDCCVSCAKEQRLEGTIIGAAVDYCGVPYGIPVDFSGEDFDKNQKSK